jgi:hypothetical protein
MIEPNRSSRAERLLGIVARAMISGLDPIIEGLLVGSVGQPAKLEG